MAIINFLFGNRTNSGFQLSGVVEFSADLTIEERHERNAQVTEHPVESGAKVSDHVILSPERVIISGFVSDAGVAVFGSQPGKTQGAFDTLESAWRSRETISVVSGYKTYQDMIITRLNLPRNRPESMQFDIELQHVTIVSAAMGELGQTSNSSAIGTPANQEVGDATASRSEAGRQPTQPSGSATTQAAESAQRQSTLAGFF